jgi:hypothetical protein
MKKTITLISFLMIVLGLTACGNGAANTDPGTAQVVNSLLPTDYENALPATTQLVVGTLKLDGTANEVDVNQAAELLTLWQAARSLSSSDSTAPEELNALFKQIEETMTPEQIQAIKDMKPTREDMSQVFQQMGMNFGAGEGRFANMTPEQLATAQAARQSGQGFPRGDFSGGGPPPGDFAGGFPGGGEGQGFRGGQTSGSNGQSGNSTNGNNSSNGQTNLNGSRFGSAFYDVVIQYLQEKVNPGSSNQQPGNQATSQPGNQ